MKFAFLLTIFLSAVQAQDFIRELPDQKFLEQVNTKNFPNADAVILIKEQSIKVEDKEIFYRGVDLKGLSLQHSNIKIVKMLNEAAVRRYGTFEFSYPEFYGDEIPSGFEIIARVLKKSGDIEEVPGSEINKIVSLTDKHDEPIERKIIMKVPNLEVGDVLQIEYHHNQPFSIATSGMFYYQDKDPVLFSNVYITLPAKSEIDVFSFPEDKIGKPQVQQVSETFGAGQTFFFSVKNCNAIPDEPFSFPFSDVSFLTGFTIKRLYGKEYGSWNSLIKNYYEDYIDRDNLSGLFFEKTGIEEDVKNVTPEMIDTLYTKIKRNFRLRSFNRIYPEDDINDAVETGEGDATDLSFMMYKVLNEWKQDADIVLIRDKRDGLIETSFPSLMWFDRIGVLVKTEGKEKIYDFDISVQNHFENPWFLNGVNLYVVNDAGGYFKKHQFLSGTENNQIIESHWFTFEGNQEIKDSLNISYKGCFAERFREDFYWIEKNKISDKLKTDLASEYFSKIEICCNGDILENSCTDINFCGTPQNSIEEVDSFLIFRPREIMFSRFNKNLYSTARKNHIIFDSPFKYIVEFNIPVPEGYEVKTIPEEVSITTPFKGSFLMKCENNDNIIKTAAVLTIPQNQVEVFHYPKVIELLESSIKASNREIVFKKL